MKTAKLLTFLSCIAISACSSNNFKEIPYGCDADESDPYCASVEKLYEHSVSNEHRKINVLAPDSTIKRHYSNNHIQSQYGKYSDSAEEGNFGERVEVEYHRGQAPLPHKSLDQTPVYTPESVHKLYRGPWRDDYEFLHSGELLFYKTPGYWNFGTLKTPGSASGMLQPVLPDELGFKRGMDVNNTDTKRAGRYRVDPQTGNTQELTNARRAAQKIN